MVGARGVGCLLQVCILLTAQEAAPIKSQQYDCLHKICITKIDMAIGMGTFPKDLPLGDEPRATSGCSEGKSVFFSWDKVPNRLYNLG